MKAFGYNTTQSGLLWGLAATVEMFVMYGAGALSDRWGRTPLLASGALGIALTNLGYLTLAGFFPALIAVQLVRGVGFGSYTTSAMTFAAEHGDHRTRGRKTGVFNTIGSAGGLAGTLLAGNLVQVLGFGTLYGTCVVLALTSALCFLLLRRQTASRLSTPSSVVA
jgi:MFS family permease